MGQTKPTGKCNHDVTESELFVSLKANMDVEARLLCRVILTRLDKLDRKINRLARKLKKKKGKR
jgi:hypothetical protein